VTTSGTLSSDDVTVYAPTVTGLPPMRAYLAGLWERRPLMWHLTRTDLKGQHFDTAFGQIWIILDPLLLAAVYYLLRSVVRPIGNAEARQLLIAHLVMGIFFFYYTRNSAMDGARSIVGNKQLVLNTSFPRAVFPIVSVMKAFCDFMPTLIVYFLLHWLLGQPFGVPLVLLPAVIVVLTIFNLGCAFFFAPLNVFFRDTQGFLPYIFRVWLYVSPILFLIPEIPDDKLIFFQLNPLYAFYAVLEPIWQGEWPSWGWAGIAVAWAVGAFVIGSVTFLIRERDFAIRL